MKKKLTVSALVLALLLLIWMFWDPILDFLPIDQSGWVEDETGRSYLDEDGDPLTGWQNVEGSRYYFDPETGAMHTGWLDTDGSRYHLGDDGRMRSDCWIREMAGTYYLNTDGTMATGWVERNGIRHYFNSDGTVASGWLELEDGRYYFNTDGTTVSGWLTLDEKTYFFDEEGFMHTGFLDTEEGRFYLGEDGTPASGWVEADGARYRLNEDGSIYTGWLEEGGQRYYLTEDGSAAVGRYVIGEETFFFTSTGANIILVNPWNPVPEDYAPDLVYVENARVDASCADALEQMLEDCRAAGYYPSVVSSYRSIADQTYNFRNLLNTWMSWGYSYGDAYSNVAQIIAVPGTSEHHLGLALDIVDSSYPKLNYYQANMATQKWLMENCWQYGFILRYPEGTTEITGIIYEPWHYRYVGLELAKEIHELGDIPLEVYIDNLTDDGSTCGGKLVILENGE